MPEPGMGSGGARSGAGMGGGGPDRDDVERAIEVARQAAPGALERLAAGNKFVGRPIEAAPQKTIAQKVYNKYLHPQKAASTLLGITPQEWVSHVTKPAPGNVTVNAPATAPASTRFGYASRKASDFVNKSNIRQNLSNPFTSGLGVAQLAGTGLLGALHQGWQGIQNMNDPNSPGHQFGAFDWRSYPNLVDFGGNMAGLLGFGTKVD